jgi:adhesin/invasin
MKANPGEVRANGTDTALVVVEVWDSNGNYVDGETVTFSATLGSMEEDTVTTNNGVAVNTYTSSSEDGMAIVAAAVENIVTKVEIVQFYTSTE